MRLDILNGRAFLIDAIPGQSHGLQELGFYRRRGFDHGRNSNLERYRYREMRHGWRMYLLTVAFRRINSIAIGISRFPIRKKFGGVKMRMFRLPGGAGKGGALPPWRIMALEPRGEFERHFGRSRAVGFRTPRGPRINRRRNSLIAATCAS